ncbi:MAG: hypothetical protein RIS70_95, partial [Planctomycetota bacterium]
MLGEGSYGQVWLAEDLELQRQVALKKPRGDWLRDANDIQTYLTEARVLASLDHSHIVPVFDAGHTADGSCYVVSKWIDGMDLAAFVKQRPLSFEESVTLVAQVADALQETHVHGLVHRDIKPANILMDRHGRPYVTDFGLAIRDADLAQVKSLAGTPAYMSPEQARSEGHLIDGRSDIFSLGVVLYELLTGVRPFLDDDWHELLEKIKRDDPKPPRQCHDAIPKELERICLKALSKRAVDRYESAAQMAEDLRYWLHGPPADLAPIAAKTRIVPKGLHAFDAGDRDFFLELLPGPRDRDGLPETVRFWKARLEETDPQKTFRVGLLYGPSGCGKSSLMKAGILPRLADHVVRVFVEATPENTESQLLTAIRRICSELPDELTLTEAFYAIRHGAGIPARRNLVIVLDQFEQWLYAHGAESMSMLANALRQCDGERIKVVLLVRDDFWAPASRFLQQLEVRVLDGQNAALVDVFDLQHARKVLFEYGKAYDRLPEDARLMSSQQQAFLDKAVRGLAEDGKVICVRLALFADMMKSRDWTTEALDAVGGTEGIGATFLEETFSSRSANRRNQRHQVAAQAVLHALLPGTGADIKGHVRSSVELLEASGYGSRPDDFAELIGILDNEVRLITPVENDPRERMGAESARDPAGAASTVGDNALFYQLTHDYLVPSLRDWLSRKQRETYRGRAEISLEEQAAIWNAKPENRYLPSLAESIRIRCLTNPWRWTDGQQRMMKQAVHYHGIRSGLSVLVLGFFITAGTFVSFSVTNLQERARIKSLVEELPNATASQLPELMAKLEGNLKLAVELLSPVLMRRPETSDERRTQMVAHLVAVPADPALIEPLAEELLSADTDYVAMIVARLRPSADRLVNRYRALLQNEQADRQQRFRAAVALASYGTATDVSLWSPERVRFVVEQLLAENAEDQPALRVVLGPIRERMARDLERIFSDPNADETGRLSAANAIADYWPRNVVRLTKLLPSANPKQFAVIYPLVASHPKSDTLSVFEKITASQPGEAMGALERIHFGAQRANAAAAMLRLGERESVLPALRITDDPEALTQFMFACRSRGVEIGALLDCLRIVRDAPRDRYPASARAALLLTLGEYNLDEFRPASRKTPMKDTANYGVKELVNELSQWYADDPNSGVHAAAGWLLRRWGFAEIAERMDQTAVPYSPDREWFTLAIRIGQTGGSNIDAASPSAVVPGSANSKPTDLSSSPQTFYFTFVTFPAGEYLIGSVADEAGRQKNELRHRVTIQRPFAMLDREITLREMTAFSARHALILQPYDVRAECASSMVNWYDAVSLCRWLGTQAGFSEADQPYAAAASIDRAQYPRESNPVSNYAPRNWPVDLSRRGFRLPTEA